MKHLAGIVIALASWLAWVPGASAQSTTPQNFAICTGCHGMHGEGAPTGVPRLAGQNTDYLSHALSMFKAGSRDSPIMQAIAKGLSDSDISAAAEYFSGQTAPPVDAHSAASAQLVGAGKQLAESGVTNAASCFSCHGPGGKGNGARYPSIAGQPARFVIDRLHEFQARARTKAPPPGSMTAVAAGLSEQQIEASAAYLARLER
jgi:cytochrome c553